MTNSSIHSFSLISYCVSKRVTRRDTRRAARGRSRAHHRPRLVQRVHPLRALLSEPNLFRDDRLRRARRRQRLGVASLRRGSQFRVSCLVRLQRLRLGVDRTHSCVERPGTRVDGDGVRLFLGGAVAQGLDPRFPRRGRLGVIRGLQAFLLLAVLRFSRVRLVDSALELGALRGFPGSALLPRVEVERARGSGADERGGGDEWGRWCASSLSSSTWRSDGDPSRRVIRTTTGDDVETRGWTTTRCRRRRETFRS